jgi:hypothetical protein
MIITNENYFSKEASLEFLGSSQYKSFAGTSGKQGCEAKAIAELNGYWGEEKTTALLVGGFVDAHFEGTLDIFKAQNPEIFTKKGELKAEYKKANEIITRVERDPKFMQYMSGEKQVIMTGEFFGSKWKIKIDSYHPNIAIVDLKCMASLTKSEWVKDYGKMNFVEYWGYTIQGAIYQKIVELNTGKKLPFYIAGVTKEKEPNLEIIEIDNGTLSDALSLMESNVSRIISLKKGEIEPDRCGHCDYCRFTKILTGPIHFSQIMEGI